VGQKEGDWAPKTRGAVHTNASWERGSRRHTLDLLQKSRLVSQKPQAVPHKLNILSIVYNSSCKEEREFIVYMLRDFHIKATVCNCLSKLKHEHYHGMVTGNYFKKV